MKKVVIIGAGPAGLTAAYYLLQSDQKFDIKIYEKDKVAGGLSKSIEFNGNKVDIGGHRFFSKSKLVNNIWQQVLPFSKDGFHVRKRLSHIYYNDYLIEYPINISLNTFKCIGWKKSICAVFSYLKATVYKRNIDSLEDFYINQFGRTLYELFFRDYTKKLWGISADSLSADWGRQRVRKISLFLVLKKALGIKSDEKSFANVFAYPMNGSGQMWDKMAIQVCEMGANIFYSKNITRIEKDLDARYMLEINNECMEKADIVISSMPLGDLGRKILEIPKEVQKVTDNLQYRDMIIVAIEFDEKYVGKRWDELRNDTWLYVQQNDIQCK